MFSDEPRLFSSEEATLRIILFSGQPRLLGEATPSVTAQRHSYAVLTKSGARSALALEQKLFPLLIVSDRLPTFFKR